jgi:hypothetical protein
MYDCYRQKRGTCVWRRELMCDVIRIEYDFEWCIGTAHFAEHNCCDMSGCINLFKRIDPYVKRIITFAGQQQDTWYKINAAGEWEAFLPIKVA